MISAVFVALLLTLVAVLQPTPAVANVQDFHYGSWDSEITLTLDERGRATAHVVETLVAIFPDSDQNKGIVRGLPLKLHGAHSAPENITVTDESGSPLPFFTAQEDGFRAILTGDDAYVHGRQTYVLSYEIPDPIFQPDDANIDEYYWDMVSVDRLQPIESFSASVTLDPALEDAFLGQATAYRGKAGSTDTIDMHIEDSTLSIDAVSLGKNEVVTFALGFSADTVLQPNTRTPNFVMDVLPVATGALSVVVSALGLGAISQLKKRRRTTGKAVIAQYDVPQHLPPLLASQIRTTESVGPIPAQFLHLAVNGYMRIEEKTRDNGELYKKPKLQFHNLMGEKDPAKFTTDPLNVATFTSLFTKKHPKIFSVPKHSTSFSSRMEKLTIQAREESDSRGYFTKERSSMARNVAFLAIAILIMSIFMSTLAFVTGFDKGYTGVAFVLVVVSIPLVLICFSRHRVHTESGAEAYEYLEGVKQFIQVAEADRLRMLQSYEGAERFLENDISILNLYERLLPYAVLFKLEKEWGEVLRVRYESQHISGPYWYPALAIRGYSQLGESLSTASGQMSSASSYTASSSSGSSGGGFAGGGGGGGFSGGR